VQEAGEVEIEGEGEVLEEVRGETEGELLREERRRCRVMSSRAGAPRRRYGRTS
jgi:hypothetical protein